MSGCLELDANFNGLGGRLAAGAFPRAAPRGNGPLGTCCPGNVVDVGECCSSCSFGGSSSGRAGLDTNFPDFRVYDAIGRLKMSSSLNISSPASGHSPSLTC